jgi:hypothetical protein
MAKNSSDFDVEFDSLMDDIKRRKKKTKIILLFVVFISLAIGILKGVSN